MVLERVVVLVRHAIMDARDHQKRRPVVSCSLGMGIFVCIVRGVFRIVWLFVLLFVA